MSSSRVSKKIIAAAGIAAAASLVGMSSASAAPDSPDDITLKWAIFVAKDFGGGGYWLTTTTAQTSLDTAVETGREGLLTVNETVLVPVEEAIT